MKKIILVLSFVIAFTSVSFAGEWVSDNSNWKYKEDNGTFATSTWKFLKNGNDYNNYYFDENGYMVTGIRRIDGEVYAFNDDGTAKSKSTVTIDGEEYETQNKGLVYAISGSFDVDAYNAKLADEKKKKEESIAASNAEKKRIEESIQQSIANRTPEEKAMIAASESASIAAELAKEASIVAAEMAAEQKRISDLNNTIRISNTLPAAVIVEGEGEGKSKGKVTINLLIPTLVGGNSGAINAVLPDKIKSTVYRLYEEKYGETQTKLSVKVKRVDIEHKLDEHILVFYYYNENDYIMFRLYMDTNTLEMWSD